MATLNGRIALVTGASRGIGQAVALELASRGANVAVNYLVHQAEAEAVAKQIRGLGREYLLVKGNVGKPEEARAVIQQVIAEWKHLDILLNNAGIIRDKSLRKMTDDDWALVIAVNLSGAYYCISAALPSMIEQKFGRIINITSMIGEAGGFGQANYAASKAGILGLTKTVALEMAKYNITANAVSPGYTTTDIVKNIPQNVLDNIIAKIPLGRFAQPEEIAKAVAFLAGEGDYITGQQIGVNGGAYMP
jgi:acetoacetyl-CoA reductase